MSIPSLNARRGKSIVILSVLLLFAILGVSAFIPQAFASSTTPQAPLASSSSAISCSPSPVYVGSTTTCTATTGSGSFSFESITFSSSSNTGTFPSGNTCISYGSCSVTYSDSTPGTYSISASTGSGSTNDLGSFSLTVVEPPATSSVQCSPYPIYVDSSTTCTATIAGVSSGSVKFTTTSNSGAFPSTAYGDGYCTLVDYSCSVTYSDSTAGTYSITASYSAYSNTLTVSATFSLTVLNPQAGVSVACHDFTLGSSTTCTATVLVSNFYLGIAATGFVGFTSTSATGSFVNNQCSLSSGSCSVTYSDSTAGTYNITATYSGDQSNPPSSATYPVIVSPEPVFSITTSNGASVCTSYYFGVAGAWDASTDTCTSSSIGFAINGVEIVTIGPGVTLVSTGTSGSTSAGGGTGFYNYGGTINNYGTIIATGGNGADGGFGGYAASCPSGVFVGSNGAPGGGGGTGGDGVYNYNYGTINNYGTITGLGGSGGNGGQGGDGGSCTIGTPGDGGRGGDGGVPGSDIYNLGTINNYGTITSTEYLPSGGSCDACGGTGGNGGNGGGGENYGQGGNGANGGSFISNPGTINNYATITGSGGSGGSGGIGGGGYDFLGLGTKTTYGGGNGGSGGSDIQNSGTINNYATITGYGGNGGSGAPGNDAGHLTTKNCPDCYSGTGGNGGNGGTAISNSGTINNYGSFLSSSFIATSATSSQTTFDVMKDSGTTNIKGQIDVTGGNPANGGAYGVSGGTNGGTNPNNGTPNGIAGNGGYGFANNGIVNNYATTSGTGGQSNTVYFSSGTYGIYNSAGSVIDNLGVIESSNAAQGDYNTYNLGTINNDGLFNYGGRAGDNLGAVNDYCGFTVTFDNSAPTTVSCNAVNFAQSNLGYTATWGVTTHWGPFTLDYRGTGSVANEQIAGTLKYSYDNANDSGRIYQCYSSECSNTIDYPATITASYGNPTATSVSCSPAISYPGSSIKCTATINSAVSPTPTDTVSFITDSSTGTFVNNVCTLSAGSCSVYYSDTTPGTHTLTAYYIGDAVNAPSSVTSSVIIDKAMTSTNVSCQKINVALSTKCTATVNSAASPTGTVTFTDIPYIGSFTPSNGQCTLSAGSCSVTYSVSDSYSGPPSITASYGGDSLNNPSSGTSSPTIVISITTSNGATFCPDYLFGNWDAITHTCSSPMFYFPVATIDIAAGVTLSGTGVTNTYSGFVPGFNSSGTLNNYGAIQSIGGFNSSGTVNNYGTIQSSGGSYSYGTFYGIYSNGTINNFGNMSGSSVMSSPYGTAYGIGNLGTINNAGNMNGSSSNNGGSGIFYIYGIDNNGTINNIGNMSGTSSANSAAEEYGIDNFATINNAGNLAGTSSGSSYTVGIVNQNYYDNYNLISPSINNYCGATILSNSAAFTPDRSYSCQTVSFTQSGLASGVSWGVTTSWAPFVLPVDHTSTLSTITTQLTGSFNYTYDSPIADGTQSYECSYGCSATMSSGTSFSAYYSLSPVSCTPSTLSIGPTTTCKITIEDIVAPTGTVTFSSSSSTGSFTPSSGQCTLSAGSCSVSYSDLAPGTVTIMAHYSDSNNVPSSHAFILTVANSIAITTSDGVTICPDFLSGTWNSASDTCSSGTSGFVINAGSTLDIGTGVTISGTSNSGTYGINNYGRVNNSGTLSGASSYPSGDNLGIGNNGTINNYGTISGSDSGTFTTYAAPSNYGIYNNGTINNVGTISGSSSASDYAANDYGIYNNGTINNAGTMNGTESAAYVNGYGIYNNGTINNAGTMSGASTSGGIYQGVYDNYIPYSNPPITATINNYCTVLETSNGQQNTYGTYENLPTFYSIIPISCNTVSFTQSGLPSGTTWGVTTSWGPFVLPVDHTGTLSTISVQLTGSFNYTYDGPVTSSGISYDCSTGCSGIKVTGTTFNAAYLIPLTISCPPSPVVTGSSVSCTVLVTDTSSNPTVPSGTITFSSDPTITSLNLPASCQLSGLSSSISSCTVSFTPAPGSQASYNITAHYGGDSIHSASSNIAAFVVQQPNTTEQGSSTTTISGGAASSDQSSATGISVTISGSSSDGSSVTITTEDLSSPSTGVTTSILTDSQYYDVSIQGITDGTAQVCLTSPTATTMQYWDGSEWVNATSITVSGSKICGNIPVSALIGTNLVIGQTTYSVTFDQTGIPSNVTWDVTVGSNTYTGQGSIVVSGLQGILTYSYETSVSGTTGTQYECTGAICSGSIDSATTITSSYQTQYLLTFENNPISQTVTVSYTFSNTTSGSGSTPLMLWVDSSASPVSFTFPPTVSQGSDEQYSLVSDPHSPFSITGPATISAVYQLQYLVTFAEAGSNSPVSISYNFGNTTTGTLNGITQSAPGSIWMDASTSSVSYSYESVVSGSTGVQYSLTSVSPAAPQSSGPSEVLGAYQTQYLISFAQSGSSSAPLVRWQFNNRTSGSGTVPFAIWADASTSNSVSYTYPLSLEGTTGIQYELVSVSSASISAISSPATVTGSYQTQYLITFNQDGSGSPLTVSYSFGGGNSSMGSEAAGSGLWVDASTGSITFTYPATVPGATGTRYALASVDTTSPLTISSPATITGTYRTQYLLTVNGGDNVEETPTSSGGWYNAGTSVTVSSDWTWSANSGGRNAITNYQIDSVNQNPTRQATGTLTTSSIPMNSAHTITFVSVTQYYLAVSGGDGITYGTPSPTSDNWYDSGSSSTVSSSGVYDRSAGTGERVQSWNLDGGADNSALTTGTVTTSSITMDGPHAVSFNSIVQYYLIDNNPSGAESSITQPTISGDTGWYDQGTVVTVSLNNIYGTTSTQRNNLVSYSIDTTTTPVTRAASGTQSFNVPMGGAHTISSTYNSQFLLTVTSAYGKITLTGSQTGDNWFDSGSSATFSVTSPITCETGCQEFFLSWIGSGSGSYSGSNNPTTITVGSAITETASFVTQYLVTFEYTLNGGGSPTAPMVSYTSGGVSDTGTASLSSTSSPNQAWVDAGTSVTYTNPLVDSGTSERWQTSIPITGSSSTIDPSVSITETLNPTYYHQFHVSLGYSTNDGTTINSVSNLVSYTQFGGAMHLSTGTSGTLSLSSGWADAGTPVTFVSPVSVSSTERYQISSADSGANTVISSVSSSSTSANPEYYHQFKITFAYSTGDGTVSNPSVAYTQFDTASSVSPAQTGTSVWADSTTTYTYDNPTSGSSSTERWMASTTPAGTISSSTTITPIYYHQFSVTWSYFTQDGSTPVSSVAFSGTQFGNPYTAGGSGSGWLDASTLASFQSSIPSSPTNEIWTTSPSETITQPSYSYQTSITVGSGSTVLATEYYHQYLATTSYSTSDSTTPSSSVVLTGTAFGGPSTAILSNTPQTTWLDAGTGWSLNNPITDQASTERWYAASGTSGTITQATTIYPEYDHEFLLTVTTNPLGLSPSPSISPKSSSGWYSSGTTVTLTANTVSGYTFILWQVDGTNGTLLASSSQVTMDQPHSLVAYYESPANAVQSLVSTINGMPLQQGTQSSLDAKLNATLSSLNSGNTKAATNQLNAFINEVNAQSGKHISAQQAELLSQFAQDIINSVNARF